MPKHTIWTTLFHTWLKHLLSFSCCYTSVGLTYKWRKAEGEWIRYSREEVREEELGSQAKKLREPFPI